MIRGDREVAGQHDLEAAAEGKAVDRRNHGLEQIEPPREAGKARVRMVVASGPGAYLDVAADAKGSLAGGGEDRDAKLGVAGVEIEGAGEFAVRWRIERVQHLRPVDGDRQHTVLALDAAVLELLHGWRCPLRSILVCRAVGPIFQR